eukprot:m.129199 g.129199  ORF g.129199 m.129199 type:complete len:732 (+) comp19933_c0_seq1:123-2318(+)
MSSIYSSASEEVTYGQAGRRHSDNEHLRFQNLSPHSTTASSDWNYREPVIRPREMMESLTSTKALAELARNDATASNTLVKKLEQQLIVERQARQALEAEFQHFAGEMYREQAQLRRSMDLLKQTVNGLMAPGSPSDSSLSKRNDKKKKVLLRKGSLEFIQNQEPKGVDVGPWAREVRDVMLEEKTQTYIVTLQKVEGKLGILIGGGDETLPLCVSRIVPGSPADLCGKIRVNDRILKIDDFDVERASHEGAMALLRMTEETVTFELSHDDENEVDDDAGRLPSMPEVVHTPPRAAMLLSSASSSKRNSMADTADSRLHDNVTRALAPAKANVLPSTKAGALVIPPFGQPAAAAVSSSSSSPLKKDNMDLVKLELFRGKSGFGFTVAAVVDDDDDEDSVKADTECRIYVDKISPDGIAKKDGRLRVGDRILKVGKHNLINMSQDEAMQVLRGAGQVMSLTVGRTKSKSILNSDVDEFELRRQLLTSPAKAPFPRPPPLHQLKSPHAPATPSSALAPSPGGAPTRTDAAGLGASSSNSNQPPAANGLDSTLVRDDDGREDDVRELAGSRSSSLRIGPLPDIPPFGARRSSTTLIQSESEADEPDASDVPQASHHSVRQRRVSLLERYREMFPLSPLQLVIIEKGKRSLGIGIKGGTSTSTTPGIFVDKVLEHGMAHEEGSLRPRDRILNVNGTDLENATKAEAVKALKQAGATVDLIVLRSPEVQPEPTTHL